MKILYTATVLSHVCQFHLPHLEMLKERGYEIHVAAHDNLAEKNGLRLRFADKFIEIPFDRSPASLKNFKAFGKLRRLISSEHYDLIVCNTPVGGIVTRLAAKRARRSGTKVIYIAHGFHFYKGAPKKSWLLFYPIEKLMAKHCDVLVTVNGEDFALAKTRFKKVTAEHIHGVGVREDRYRPASAEECAKMRKAEGLDERDFVLLCTGELNENKDQKTFVSAAARLIEKIPELKVLLAGNGPKENELRGQIKALGLENTVKLLGYRTDLENLVPAVDAVVSCSRREGMPLNIIEAMLCEKPVVASVNRGHSELVNAGVNGYLFPAGDDEKLAECLEKLYEDAALRASFGKAGFEIAQDYTVSAVKSEMERIIK